MSRAGDPSIPWKWRSPPPWSARREAPRDGDMTTSTHWPGWPKRAFDVVVASVGLIVLAPLLGATALTIRLALGRPVLFAQRRPGRHARPFTIYKFRTMSGA